ncbi:hypothetical protein LCGC14_0964740 [marine sediment metagenome]|uniref:Uncharacterized protein n=1 Tax=marine sediment metagenome TaxID=412755 RepID=A0A0F9NHX1_9ZZZZ
MADTVVDIDEDSKHKIWQQLKLYIGAELARNYPMHGYQYLASEIADEFTEAMVVTHKRLLGKNIPLTKQGVLDRLRERRKK